MEDQTAGEMALEVARRATLAVVAAALTAYVIGSPIAGAGVGGAVAALGDKLAALELRRRRSAMERWWIVVLDDETRTPEGVADAIREKLDDPGVADAVMRSIRAALDAPEEAVIPGLAMLAKDYVGGSRPVDPFFRGVSRMLVECDRADIHELHRTLDEAQRVTLSGHPGVAVYAVNDEPHGSQVILGVRSEPEQPGSLKFERRAHLAPRVVHLLSTGIVGSSNWVLDGMASFLSRRDVDRLLPILAACSS